MHHGRTSINRIQHINVTFFLLFIQIFLHISSIIVSIHHPNTFHNFNNFIFHINFKNQIPLKETNLNKISLNLSDQIHSPPSPRQFLPTPRRIQLLRETQSHFLKKKSSNIPSAINPPPNLLITT